MNYKNKEQGQVFVCRCEEITKQEVIDAISEGYDTVNSIRKRTRAGMGFCQGKTCSRIIQQIIADHTEHDSEKIVMARSRPPVRPIPSGIIAAGSDEIHICDATESDQ